MGQKINPTSLRLPLSKNWRSRWFADKSSDYRRYLLEDLKIRRHIDSRLGKRVGIDHVDIERSPNMVSITVYTSRPGVVIGRGGSGIEELKKSLIGMASTPIKVAIEEVKKPELRAQIVADNIASQLERRIAYRRAVHSSIDAATQAGAKGIKVVIAGRLGGIEMARKMKEIIGSIPLHTLRADIDYGRSTASTPAGLIGVKVWINRGQNL